MPKLWSISLGFVCASTCKYAVQVHSYSLLQSGVMKVLAKLIYLDFRSQIR